MGDMPANASPAMQAGLPDTAVPAPELAAGLEKPSDALKPVEADNVKGTAPAGGSSDVAPAAKDEHPSGKEAHGRVMQVMRIIALFTYFTICTFTIIFSQVVGSPLYFVNRDWYYAYMAMTKRYFAIVATVMTHVWGPTTLRISGDESVAGQIHQDDDGNVRFDFPERMVLIANHQIYTDWMYLWWVGYANRPGMHGHIYIILKESLKHIPILGWGMQFYSFIFMSRKMATDQHRLTYRLNKLKQQKIDPRTGKKYYDPMWLLLFPEGTNLSNNGRRKSAGWAKKQGLRDPEHVMLPRSTGMFFCLQALRGSLDYVYDCTVAYEGIGRGAFGEEIFGLASTYFQGRPPKSVNFYWRRFKLSEIPLDDQEKFDLWLREEWYKKDALMEEYLMKGRLPPMIGAKSAYVETDVRTRQPWEILQVFTILGLTGLVWNNVRKAYQAVSTLFGL
jgi:lysocardiolipin and lysophospholipid acyltransferase